MVVEKKNENEFYIIETNSEANMLLDGLVDYQSKCSDDVRDLNKQIERVNRLRGEAEELEEYLRKVMYD